MVNNKWEIYIVPQIEINTELVNELLDIDIIDFDEYEVDADNELLAYALIAIHELTHAQRDKEFFKYTLDSDMEVNKLNYYTSCSTHSKDFIKLSKINFDKCKSYLLTLGLEAK